MKTWEQVYIEQIVKWSELVTEDKPLDRYWCVMWVGNSTINN